MFNSTRCTSHYGSWTVNVSGIHGTVKEGVDPSIVSRDCGWAENGVVFSVAAVVSKENAPRPSRHMSTPSKRELNLEPYPHIGRCYLACCRLSHSICHGLAPPIYRAPLLRARALGGHLRSCAERIEQETSGGGRSVGEYMFRCGNLSHGRCSNISTSPPHTRALSVTVSCAHVDPMGAGVDDHKPRFSLLLS